MPRLFSLQKPATKSAIFRGRSWIVQDEVALAHAIANLALGQWVHVEQMLSSSQAWSDANADYAINGAIRDLTVPAGKDSWHRDGWVFQLISWLVAVESGMGPARPPQMDQASKGFDGLQLVVSSDRSSVKRMLIFEDKATDNPRSKVRDDVWPSFKKLEAGDRNHSLAAEAAYLLTRLPKVDPQSAVNTLMRKPNGRGYRVSVTVGAHHGQSEDYNGLFDGYDDAVGGARHRRHANVFETADIRAWMNALCNRAITILEEMRDV